MCKKRCLTVCFCQEICITFAKKKIKRFSSGRNEVQFAC